MNQSLELNFGSPVFKANPYPTLAHLRADDPVYQISSSQGQNGWLITRYADAERVLRDERFIKDRQHIGMSEHQPHRFRSPDLVSIEEFTSTTLVDFDPPDHTRLRSLVHLFFTPRQIERWSGRIQEIVDMLIDQAEEKGSMDLVEEFAALIPLNVILEMLGIPAEDGAKLHRWTSLIGDSFVYPAPYQEPSLELYDFYAYLTALIEKKRQTPGDDLVSKLLQMEAENGKLSKNEVFTMTFLLITAGHDTTDNLISCGALALLTHPEQMALLKSRPELIKTAIEEFLRYRSPFHLATIRWAREDVQLGGKQIRSGDPVLISLAAANRDEEIFKEPDILDITRQDNHHLAFGKGLHYCLGAPLARLEGQIAISTLLRRLPNLRLQTDPANLSWRPGWLIQGLHHLPVTF
jgi:cytochrome P450